MKRYPAHPVWPLLAAVLGAAPVSFSQGPASTAAFHVAGVVLAEGTNVPVQRCHLSIRPEGQRNERRRGGQAPETHTAETDAQGRFSFDLPSEGNWQLSASANGFRTQFYNEHEGFSSAVVVHSARPVPPLIFHLEPDSSISGFVHDEAAEPVRNASVTLQAAEIPSAFRPRRQRTMTDDRGHYEIAGIGPGTYKVSVQATPWYTTGAGGRFGGGQMSSRSSDPVFDVVYPVTWYPGVQDVDTAGEINLHGGQTEHVDFNLVPIPAAHLRVVEPPGSSTTPGVVPSVERVENGQSTGVATPVSYFVGQIDFGNLAPGLYRINTPQPDGHSTTAFLHVAAGATISLAGMDTAGTAIVEFQLAGEENSSRVQITLTDASTGTIFTSFSGAEFGLRRRSQPEPGAGTDHSPLARSLAVPAGRYQVTLTGDPDLYLRSIALAGKAVAGRIVTLGGGPAALTLNIARGRASVVGHTTSAGKPVDGAMVMLVPTTFGQAGSIDLLRRDQSNTDGSFELLDVIPGDYILLAIDRGWEINWHDPVTLNRYLVHGIPLSLQPHSKAEQQLETLPP